MFIKSYTSFFVQVLQHTQLVLEKLKYRAAVLSNIRKEVSGRRTHITVPIPCVSFCHWLTFASKGHYSLHSLTMLISLLFWLCSWISLVYLWGTYYIEIHFNPIFYYYIEQNFPFYKEATKPLHTESFISF